MNHLITKQESSYLKGISINMVIADHIFGGQIGWFPVQQHLSSVSAVSLFSYCFRDMDCIVPHKLLPIFLLDFGTNV